MVALHRGIAGLLFATRVCPTKSTPDLTAAINGVLVGFEYLWKPPPMRRAHTDGGMGVVRKTSRLKVIKLTCTMGRSPQANGLSEWSVGELARTSRRMLSIFSDHFTRKKLWESAMPWSAIKRNLVNHPDHQSRITATDILPFGVLVLAQTTEQTRPHQNPWHPAIYSCPPLDVPCASIVYPFLDGEYMRKPILSRTCSVAAVKPILIVPGKQGEFTRLNGKIIASEKEKPKPDIKTVVCDECGIERAVPAKSVYSLTRAKSRWGMLVDCNCCEPCDGPSKVFSRQKRSQKGIVFENCCKRHSKNHTPRTMGVALQGSS